MVTHTPNYFSFEDIYQEFLQEGIFEKYGVKILGTPIKSIIESEDRKLFAEKIAEINEKVRL